MIVYRKGILRLTSAANPDRDVPIYADAERGLIPYDATQPEHVYGVTLTTEEWEEYRDFCASEVGQMMLWWAWTKTQRTGEIKMGRG